MGCGEEGGGVVKRRDIQRPVSSKTLKSIAHHSWSPSGTGSINQCFNFRPIYCGWVTSKSIYQRVKHIRDSQRCLKPIWPQVCFTIFMLSSILGRTRKVWARESWTGVTLMTPLDRLVLKFGTDILTFLKASCLKSKEEKTAMWL